MYAFLNTGFFVFHSALIVFILFGWVWKKTRRVHFILSVLTAFSWFILGIWHGFGYCPFTDWHYRVRMKLGHFDMPESYIKFLFHSVTGINVDQRIIDIIAVSILGLALVLSVFLNIKDWRKKRKASAGNGRL